MLLKCHLLKFLVKIRINLKTHMSFLSLGVLEPNFNWDYPMMTGQQFETREQNEEFRTTEYLVRLVFNTYKP